MNKLFTGGHWNKSRNTTCFFPGWTKTALSADYGLRFVDAYLANDIYNVLVVEWPTQQEYAELVCQMPYLAARLAKALDNFSLASGGDVSTMIFVGHSLGAHLCGNTARLLAALKITFLAALDPAGPLFSVPWRCQFGVGANDAEVVVGVHTDAGRTASATDVGIADYYANNGTAIQPGCTAFDTNPAQCTNQFLCSHMRALFYWCEAISRPGSVIGRFCPSSSAYTAGMCSDYVTNDITVPPSTVGHYYFTTNAEAPFGKGINGA
ncbi:Phospholipase A1 [Gryllus bimaculatus]|nr:Phospholipase A1 [Gryllus bimaculatus]